MGTLPTLNTQQPDPLSELGKVMQIKNAQQAGQLNAEQIKAAQMENAKREKDLQDTQTINQAITQALSTNPSATLRDILPSLGGKISPQTFIGLQDSDMKLRKGLADMNKADIDGAAATHGQLQQAYNGVMALPDDQTVAQNWPQIAQSVNAIPGNTKLKLDPAKPMTKAQISQLAPTLDLNGSYLDAEMAKRQEKAKTETAESEDKLKQIDLQNAQQYGGATSQQAENRYRTILQKLGAHQAVSTDDLDFAHGYEAANRKTTSTSDTLGISSTNTSGPSGLSAVAPRSAAPGAPAAGGTGKTQSPKDSLVDLVGQYKVDPSTISRMFFKHPEMLGLVKQKYPDWDQTDYNTKNKLMLSMTSGPQSKEINAINTVMGHINVLDQAVDALKNGDIKQLNRLGNALGIQVGNEAVPAFKTIVHRVGPEITTAYVQGGGGEMERFANAEDFDPNLAPGVLHNNAAITVNLLRSKIGALENQYKNTVKRDDFSDRFLTPDAKASLARFSGQPGQGGKTGQVQVTDPRGGVHTFPNQAAADAFKKAANIQ